MTALRVSLFFCILILAITARAESAAPAEPLTEFLKELVNMGSGTANGEGVDKIQARIAQELKQIGFEVELGASKLLVANFKGRESKIITLLMHADTVFEKSSAAQSYSSTANPEIATGPGVIDDKGGVVVALSGLKKYLAIGRPKYSLRVVVSPSEETGSPGLQKEFEALSKSTWLLLGFEPALDDGSIIQSRRGARWYKLSVVGKEAHAGRAHKDGVNACNELSILIGEISKLTEYSRDVTVSVGHMQGGQDKFNIVCGSAEAKIDTRFAKISDREKLHAAIEKIVGKVHVAGAAHKLEIVDDTPPLFPTPEAAGLIRQYQAAIESVEGKPAQAKSSGGASDANIFGREGLIVIDGLGPLGGKLHTEGEYLQVRSLESRAQALSAFLTNLK